MLMLLLLRCSVGVIVALFVNGCGLLWIVCCLCVVCCFVVRCVLFVLSLRVARCRLRVRSLSLVVVCCLLCVV